MTVELIAQIFELCIIPLLGVLTTFIITWLNSKKQALKQQGKFDAEAQKKAFTDVYNKVIAILGQDAVEYLNSAVGDLNEYITSKIEKEVSSNKIPSNKDVTTEK